METETLVKHLDAAYRAVMDYRASLGPRDHYASWQWYGAAVVLKALSGDLKDGREPLAGLLKLNSATDGAGAAGVK